MRKLLTFPLVGLTQVLAAYRLYRWWNTSEAHKHVGRHRGTSGRHA